MSLGETLVLEVVCGLHYIDKVCEILVRDWKEGCGCSKSVGAAGFQALPL